MTTGKQELTRSAPSPEQLAPSFAQTVARLGRPFICAAAIAGVPGVLYGIKLLREEIDRDMALIGITTLAEMRRDLLTSVKGADFLSH